MSIEQTLLGLVGIIIGVLIIILTGGWVLASIPIIIGIALIIFRKEEDKLEKRRDKK